MRLRLFQEYWTHYGLPALSKGETPARSRGTSADGQHIKGKPYSVTFIREV